MHRLLERQLKRSLGKTFDLETLTPELQELLNKISDVYVDFDDQRRMHEHIITVNSEELRNSNAKLKELLDERSQLLEYKTNENKDIINLLHQYKEAIDQSMIVSRTDTEGIITYANDKFCEISGYTREELLGRSHNIIKHPDNDVALYKDIWQTIKSNKVWTGTFPNLNKDGRTYYVNSTIIPLTDLNGNITEFIGLRDDVTQQVLYQKKLTHQTQRLNTIFNSQEHITLIINPTKGVVDVNNKFFETFGYKDLRSFNQKNECVCDLFHEKDLLKSSDNIERPWYEHFLFGNDIQNKVTHQTSTGQELIFKISIKEIELDEKQHFLVTLIDITELENARRKAEIAKETKSTFLANMSHEIRTPLNAIIGFSDVLTNAKLNSEEKEYSYIISKSAQSLLDIIDDVLDISKIESGKIMIENEPFPINIFIENIVELFSVKAKEKNIRFIYNSDPSIPYSVISDSTRLRQVLSNLLSNAIKFTDKLGQVNFSINVLQQDEKEVQMEFTIKDTGIGISKEQQAIIFEPFSQADSGINRKFGGTGLGLSICKDIIHLLNSEIIVESMINHGTTFKFILTLPIDKKTEKSSHHFSHLEFALSGISDDNEYLKKNITNYLNKIGEVYEFDQNSIHRNINFLFCFQSPNLLDLLQKFKMLNETAKTVFVGNKNSLDDNRVNKYIDYFIDLPIYGSKIFNIISDNTLVDDNIATEKEFEAIEHEPIEKHSPEEKISSEQAHILVAEDNPNNQKLIEILINKLGYRCTIANNGLEAVEFYEDNRYDLIFMDINMPVMDGVTATKEILKRQEEGRYKVPIVALTANSIEGDKERYLYSGMSDYLAKPIIFDKFKAMIEHYTTLSKETIQNEDNNEPQVDFSIENTMAQLGLDQDTATMLLENFFLTIDQDIDTLAKKVQEDDYQGIFDQAHFIKGSCLNLALKEPAEILASIESKANDNNNVNLDFDRLKLSLENHKKTIG